MVLHSGLTFESRGIDMRAIQMEQFGDPAQVLRVVDIESRGHRVHMRFW